MDFTKLDILEERISDLLNRAATLTQQNGQLELNFLNIQEELAETQGRLQEAEGRISVMQAEKETIVGKIDSILERLETV